MSAVAIGSSAALAVVVGFGFFGLRGGREFRALVDDESERRGAATERHERNYRNARQQRHHQHDRARHAQCLGIAGKLLEQRLVGRARNAGFRHQQAGGGGNDERRHLGYQAVADGEDRVGMCRVGERQALLGNTNDHAADDVDENDQQAGDGIAAYKLRGAVHGAEETAFVLQHLAPATRFLLIDETGRQIGIDCHLLAGHSVQVEAGGHFRDAAGTLGDDHEVHDHQDREHDNPDHEIAAHHEIAEGLDDVTGGIGALMAVREDQPC